MAKKVNSKSVNAASLKLINDNKLAPVSSTNLAPGNYIATKANDENDLLVRATKADKFARIPEGSTPAEGSQVLLFAEVDIVHPKSKKSRIAVPVDYLEWSIGEYFSFTVNASGFANFRDETITEDQARVMMAEEVE